MQTCFRPFVEVSSRRSVEQTPKFGISLFDSKRKKYFVSVSHLFASRRNDRSILLGSWPFRPPYNIQILNRDGALHASDFLFLSKFSLSHKLISPHPAFLLQKFSLAYPANQHEAPDLQPIGTQSRERNGILKCIVTVQELFNLLKLIILIC